jgi:prevent-host-death family protein
MMTRSVNIAVAKAHLSALVDRAAAGEEIILSRAGRPVARLMPLAEQTPRQPGVRRHWQIPTICSWSRWTRRIFAPRKGPTPMSTA